MPEIVETRRRELQQQQQQQSSSSSTSISAKTEPKSSSRTATHPTNSNEKDRSPMHHLTNSSPQSMNPAVSDRSNVDSSSTNGSISYPNSSAAEHGSSSLRPFNASLAGHSHSPATAQSHYSHNHPPSSSHPNALQPSASSGSFPSMSNGTENSSHASYVNSTNHIASKNRIFSAHALASIGYFQYLNMNLWIMKQAIIVIIILTIQETRRPARCQHRQVLSPTTASR